VTERCAWAGEDPLMQAYHDTEWGVPERDSRALWEKLVLDGFQAGLAWITVLRKRDAFRAACAGFEPERVAAFGGSLWITGRGLDLLRRSPSGAPLGTVEVGPAAMDVAASGTSLWTAAFTSSAARRGDPVAGELVRVDASGQVVARVAATRRLFVNGLAAGDDALWVYDGVAGLLVRLPT